MRAVIVRENMRIPIGRQGENDAVRIVWPGVIESYGKLYGEGFFSLIALRSGDSAPYPVSVTEDGADLVWVVSSADTAKDGFGSAELTYTVGGVVAKSQMWGTIVNTSLSGQEPTDPPEPQRNWVDEVLTAGAAAENSANKAANAAQNAVNAAAGAESAKTAAESARDTAGTSAAAAAGSAAAAQEKAAEAARSAAAATEAAAATANQPINQITGASVGQTIKVKAVDTDGKPTAWEPVDMPTGGGGETWEKIAEIELAEAASSIVISQDLVGRPFALKRVMIDCSVNIDQDNTMTYAKTLINDSSVCTNGIHNFAGKAVGYYAFYAELIPGNGALCWNVLNDFNYNWIGPLQKMGYKYNDIWESTAITKLTISANDGKKNFGIAGTKINVVGVRA